MDSIAAKYPWMGSRHYEGESDLEATLGIIDCVLGISAQTMRWETFTFTTPHHSWMAHILLYRAWDTRGTTGALSEDVTCFIDHSFSLDPPPPDAIVADYLLIIGLVLEIGVNIDDFSVVDKRCVNPRGMTLTLLIQLYCFSHEVSSQITRVYERFMAILKRSQATDDEIDGALQAMELLVPFPNNKVAQLNYNLFRVIMDRPLSLELTTKKKWTNRSPHDGWGLQLG